MTQPAPIRAPLFDHGKGADLHVLGQCASGWISAVGCLIEHHARFGKAEVRQSPGCRRADDDVVTKIDLEQLRSLEQASGQATIRIARGGIAGGVVVHEHDRIGGVD